MNILKSNFLLFLLSINSVYLPIQAELSKQEMIEYSQLSCTPREEFMINTAITAVMLAMYGATNYAITTYLVQEEHLVETDYPFAQLWYEAMTQKYPQAHLEQKLFLQTWRNFPKKYMQWCSTFHHIYCPQNELEEINHIYKKTVENHTDTPDTNNLITEEEKFILAKYEFILLHEAGHIEHNDIAVRLLTTFAMITSLHAATALYKELSNEYFYQSLEQQANKNSAFFTRINRFIGFELFPEGELGAKYSIEMAIAYRIFIIECYQQVGNFLTSMAVSRYQETNADAFAANNAELEALYGGVSFFENEEVDPLWNIEDKELSPFVEVDSTLGKIIQAYFEMCDENDLQEKQDAKKNSLLRWWHDFCNGPTHPGPSTRAQALKDEIARRLKTTDQTA